MARRWGEVFDALLEVHPVEPHWYLATLGVAPAHQRLGVGSALLDVWLEEVDRSGLMAYLETDEAENIAFYERAGFRLSNETEVQGVAIWCMRRTAHATSRTGPPAKSRQATLFTLPEPQTCTDEHS